MTVLPHREIVFAGGDEGVRGVEAPFVDDGVDCYGEEVGEGCEEGLVGVEGCHVCSSLYKFSFPRYSLPSPPSALFVPVLF